MEGVNNTHYQKLFNDDLKPTGKLFGLSNAAFRSIIILRARCDADGLVHDDLGKPYSIAKLSALLGINERTVRVAVIELSQKELITETFKGIWVSDFVFDMTARGSGNGSTRRAKRSQTLINVLQANMTAADQFKKAIEHLDDTMAEGFATPLEEVADLEH